MILSKKGIELLKQLEGFRLIPYDDQTGKVITSWVKGATIGVGHLIPSSQWEDFKLGITIERMDEILKGDLERFESIVSETVIKQLKEHEADALIIFAFNIGVRGFANSSALKLVNNPQAETSYKDLESAWLAWNKSQGKVMEGLKNRRNAEYKLYSEGVYT